LYITAGGSGSISICDNAVSTLKKDKMGLGVGYKRSPIGGIDYSSKVSPSYFKVGAVYGIMFPEVS
jgi:hypothetical protein